MMTNNISRRSYIGYTTRTFGERLKQHLYDARRGSTGAFHRALRKHGIAMWSHALLEEGEADLYEIHQTEKYFIELHDTYNAGYNCTKGGDFGEAEPNPYYQPEFEKCKAVIYKGIEHYSEFEASKVIGISLRELKNRLESPEFPDYQYVWKNHFYQKDTKGIFQSNQIHI